MDMGAGMVSELAVIKEALSNAFARAAKAKDKAEAKASVGEPSSGSSSGATASSRSAGLKVDDPAFMLSADLKDLAGALSPFTDKASDRAKDGLSKAYDALGRLEGIAAFSEGLGEELDALMDTLGRDLDRTLKAFGLDEDGRKQAAEELARLRERDDGDALRSAVSVDRASSSLTASVENIEITLSEGGKSLTLSFEKASLAVSGSASRLEARSDRDGQSLTAVQEDTLVKAESMGLDIQAKGFSAEELSGIVDRLGKAFSDGSIDERLEGLASLDPTEVAGTFSLGLSAFLDRALGAGPAATGVSLTA